MPKTGKTTLSPQQAALKRALSTAGVARPVYIAANRKIWLTIRGVAEIPLDRARHPGNRNLSDPLRLTVAERKALKKFHVQHRSIASTVLPRAQWLARQRLQDCENVQDVQVLEAILTAQEYVQLVSRLRQARWNTKRDVETLAQMVSDDGVREAWVQEAINTLHVTMVVGTPAEQREAEKDLKRVSQALSEVGGRRPEKTDPERQEKNRLQVAVSKALPPFLREYEKRSAQVSNDDPNREKLLGQISDELLAKVDKGPLRSDRKEALKTRLRAEIGSLKRSGRRKSNSIA